MWKKWAIVGIAYLLFLMVGYGVYEYIVGPDLNPAHQMEMKNNNGW